MKFLLVLLAILSLAFAENIDLDLDVEKSEWVDLFDPLSSVNFGPVDDSSSQQCANYEVIQRYHAVSLFLVYLSCLFYSKLTSSRRQTKHSKIKNLTRWTFC